MLYKSAQERNRRLKKLYQETKSLYGAGAWYNEKKERFIKYSCHNKGVKHLCEKITRAKLKESDLPCKGNTYRKLYDYWWEVT